MEPRGRSGGVLVGDEAWRTFDQASRELERDRENLLDDIERRLTADIRREPLFSLAGGWCEPVDGVDASQRYVDKIANRRHIAHRRELVELVFEQPYNRIGNVVDAGITERQTASMYWKDLCDIAVLREVKAGREKLFSHPNLMKLLTAEDHKVPEHPEVPRLRGSKCFMDDRHRRTITVKSEPRFNFTIVDDVVNRVLGDLVGSTPARPNRRK